MLIWMWCSLPVITASILSITSINLSSVFLFSLGLIFGSPPCSLYTLMVLSTETSSMHHQPELPLLQAPVSKGIANR